MKTLTHATPGQEVYFYSWYDKETGSHSEPIKTAIKSQPFITNSGDLAVFVNDVSGYVLVSHLSSEYNKEIIIKKTKAQSNYSAYLNSDICDSFADWLGIWVPRWEYDRSGLVRLCSTKYPSVKGGYFHLKKHAKADYKLALRRYHEA